MADWRACARNQPDARIMVKLMKAALSRFLCFLGLHSRHSHTAWVPSIYSDNPIGIERWTDCARCGKILSFEFEDTS